MTNVPIDRAHGALRAGLLRIPPPLVYVAAFLAGMGIEALLPVAPVPASLDNVVRGAGIVLLAVGLLLGPVNALMFLLRGTTLNPAGTPRRLFTGGVYRITRNPMYAGLLLVYAGVAVLQWQPWALLLVVVPFAAVDRVYIPFEERSLSQVFGVAYADYCRRVNRWIGVRR